MKILNRHHFPGGLPAGAVYVGRGTPLGNPYRIGQDGDRAQCIARYRADMLARYDAGDPVLLTALSALRGATALVCSCSPLPCHAEVVIELRRRLDRDGMPSFPASMAYAGIGSRSTPAVILGHMEQLARTLSSAGYTLRSGGAPGADSAFERGSSRSEIYLPWRGFERRTSGYTRPTRAAVSVASCVHPAWNDLSSGGRALQGRNSHQVLGPNIDSPSDFVLCWTPDGVEAAAERRRKTGGTGQAIALADLWGIPVFNLARPDAMRRLERFLHQRHGSAIPRLPSQPSGAIHVQEPDLFSIPAGHPRQGRAGAGAR